MNKSITFQVDAEVDDAFNQASFSQEQAISLSLIGSSSRLYTGCVFGDG